MMRIALGQQVTKPEGRVEEFCLRTAQDRLLRIGAISVADANGTYNKATDDALSARFGDNWVVYPGGICALALRPELGQEATGKVSATAWQPQRLLGLTAKGWLVAGAVAATIGGVWVISRSLKQSPV